MLDKIAGVSDEKLIQVHGTFDSNHCSVCNESVNQDLVIEGKNFDQNVTF